MIDLVIAGVGRLVRQRKIHPFRRPGTQTNFLSQSKRTPDGGYLRCEKGNKLHQCWIVQFADLARDRRILRSSLTPSRKKHKIESHLDSTYSLQRAKSFAALANLANTCLEIIRTYWQYIAAWYPLNYVS
jgi:hypothetical protein